MAEALIAFLALLAGLGIGWFASGRRLSAAADELRAETGKRTAAEASANRLPDLEARLREGERALADAGAKIAELETRLAEERKAAEGQLAILNDAQQKLSDAFKALSFEALKSNNQSFLDLAKQTLEIQQTGAKADLEKRQQAITELVTPVKLSLEKFETKVGELEKAREGAYAGLTEQVKALLAAQTHLQRETTNLVQALRSPIVRGRWGEIQLRRVVEMAGMLNHCDFYEQESTQTETGRLRPDMIVRLPAGRTIVIDAKAPITSYMDAVSAATDDERKAKLSDFAKLIRTHMTLLGRKAYWDQFEPTPELVVMFLPGEHFYNASLEYDPSLIEFGVDQKVVVATPTSLISLLRAVAYGWRQESIAQNAKEISALAAELYKRLSDMGGHWIDLGDMLGKSVDAYNRAVASLETRVLVSARKFKDLGAAPEAEIRLLTAVERSPREPQAPELTGRKKPTP